MTNTPEQVSVRPLHDWEIAEAREVFDDSLRYDRVRVHECATWTDKIHRLGHRLRGLPPPSADEHNAITLGYSCFFPIPMPKTLATANHRLGMPWLIHELTHAWQYQHTGWVYLLKALWVQITLGAEGYKFGDADGLRAARQKNWTFGKFNPEQQGNITMTYYVHKRANRPASFLSAWEPFIDEIKQRHR